MPDLQPSPAPSPDDLRDLSDPKFQPVARSVPSGMVIEGSCLSCSSVERPVVRLLVQDENKRLHLVKLDQGRPLEDNPREPGGDTAYGRLSELVEKLQRGPVRGVFGRDSLGATVLRFAGREALSQDQAELKAGDYRLETVGKGLRVVTASGSDVTFSTAQTLGLKTQEVLSGERFARTSTTVIAARELSPCDAPDKELKRRIATLYEPLREQRALPPSLARSQAKGSGVEVGR